MAVHKGCSVRSVEFCSSTCAMKGGARAGWSPGLEVGTYVQPQLATLLYLWAKQLRAWSVRTTPGMLSPAPPPPHYFNSARQGHSCRPAPAAAPQVQPTEVVLLIQQAGGCKKIKSLDRAGAEAVYIIPAGDYGGSAAVPAGGVFGAGWRVRRSGASRGWHNTKGWQCNSGRWALCLEWDPVKWGPRSGAAASDGQVGTRQPLPFHACPGC